MGIIGRTRPFYFEKKIKIINVSQWMEKFQKQNDSLKSLKLFVVHKLSGGTVAKKTQPVVQHENTTCCVMWEYNLLCSRICPVCDTKIEECIMVTTVLLLGLPLSEMGG